MLRLPAFGLMALLCLAAPCFSQARAAEPPVASAQMAGQAAGTGQADQPDQPDQTDQMDTDPADDETSLLSGIWAARADDLDGIISEADALLQNAGQLAPPLLESMRGARLQFLRLSGLFQVSRGHPSEQSALAREMRVLRDRLQRAVNPLENMAETVSQRLDEITALKKDLDNLKADAASDAASADGNANARLKNNTDADDLRRYRQKLSNAEERLGAASARLAAVLPPARAVLVRIDNMINRIKASLPGIWEHYYLTPSGNTLDTVAATAAAPALLADWAASLRARLAFAYPQSGGEWFESARRFLVCAFIFGLAGYLAWRAAHSLPPRWRKAVRRTLERSWPLCGLGLAVILAGGSASGGQYFGLLLFGSLTLIAGSASMSWTCARPASRNWKSCLRPWTGCTCRRSWACWPFFPTCPPAFSAWPGGWACSRT